LLQFVFVRTAQQGSGADRFSLRLALNNVEPPMPDNDLTLKAAALHLGFVTEAEFDRVVDPKKIVKPYVAAAPATPHVA